MSIFITGGTGFIGRKIVDLLIKKGECINLLVRKTSNINGLKREGINLFTGDITDKDSVVSAMGDCDRVIHSAAYARNWARNYSVYHKFNVEGLRNVAEASIEKKVRKFVYVSTAVIFGPSFNEVINEDSSRKVNYFFTDYEKSKFEAENLIKEFRGMGLPVIIVNPTRVYGPGFLREANAVTRIVRMFLKGWFPVILSDGKAMGNYVYVDDVAKGIVLALYNGKSGTQYILGGENSSLEDFFGILSRISKRKPPGIKVPPFIALTFCKFEEILARVFNIYPAITCGWVKTFLQNWCFSSKKAEEELGYTHISLEEGLKLSLIHI